MSTAADKSDPAEISKLADGTLDPSRRELVQARIAASPELTALYERERRVVELLHEARAADRAPARLRARIQTDMPRQAVRVRRRLQYGGGLAGALAATALALVLVLPSGAPLAPSLSQAASLALRGPVTAAPAPDPSAPTVKLGRDIESVYFPNWQTRFGWRAIGERDDTISGRHAVTIFYSWRGKVVAYTIVGAPELSQPAAKTKWLNGTELTTLTVSSRLVVTWHRAGHTCILSGAGVPALILQKLAAWKAPGLERDAS